MGHYADTKIIDVSKDTFEAWKKGKKRIKEFRSCGDETYSEKDFIDDEKDCEDIVKAPRSVECPDSECVRKRLDAVNFSEIRRDLLYVINKYELAEKWRDVKVDRDGSYVFFLLHNMRLSEYGIPRKYVREEYVDPEEWEFMKDADEYAIVRQNPYMRVEDDGENIKITMWGD
ncbi:MAG: hypothetical protein FWG58_04580 [Methanomassiliicoccaceae archaeon]|nr:hypothetical protein [Methanomassiliicoccaceae archaeon]